MEIFVQNSDISIYLLSCMLIRRRNFAGDFCCCW